MSVNKFKVGDVVKCVNISGINNLTLGKEYIVLQTQTDIALCAYNDNGDFGRYCPSRFELSDSDETSQPPKFKEGDMVYLIRFDSLKPHKLLPTGGDYLTMKFRVIIDNDNSKTFTENGHFTNADIAPSLVLATEENRLMLNKLLGVEYEPLKLTGSDLAKKLLKDKPQTCYVSDNSDDYAKSKGGVVLIMEFENDRFISGTRWKFAVPCDKHGEVLEDE